MSPRSTSTSPRRRLPSVPPERPTSRPLPPIPRALACRHCMTDITSISYLLPLEAIPPESRAFRGFSAQNKPMLVELKNGETFNGHLVNCDNFMNITLREVYQTNTDGDKFWKLKECYIRGSTIKYLRIPDTLLDVVKEDQNRAREAGRNARGTHTGGPGNRGSRGAPVRGGRGVRGGPESSRHSPAAAVDPTALDSLFSPQLSSFPLESSDIKARNSIAELESELSDVALDDEKLHVETLDDGTLEDEKIDDEKPEDSRPESDVKHKPTPLDLDLEPTSYHKKSASITTIRSSRHISLLVNRDETVQARRGSADGQHKLQEEFARLQKEQEDGTVDNKTPVPLTPGLNAGVDWGFWGLVISDYQKFASERSEELSHAITKGIPSTLRGMMWQLMAASKDPELESTYLKLLKETSIHDKAILRDLGRTFPHHDFFTDGQGIGQENLYNVLKAYSIFDPQVGYCQGLPFVVAILLLNMPDEEAFSLLVRLMQVYDLRGHFLPEMPKLQLRLGIKSSMFCSQWFLTMFSYRSGLSLCSLRPPDNILGSFPLEIVFRIYDNCLASGIEAIFGFSIALLHKNEDLLLNLKFDDILAFLNTKLFDRYKIESEKGEGEGKESKYRVDEFVNDAISLRITPFMLDSYNHEYEDKVRETNKHALEVDELRNSNRALSAQVKSLESNFAQINVEHVELLNELVKARLRNEEMEGELVRYAEAMHENEDAQSSNRLSFKNSIFNMKRGSSSSKGS
ncbi:hypothetical protein D9757_000605 [Collybiopsis confluens]|uniref:Rab-GAP TBC domain-containing protein n=1 Tax=Collybiopsis confluens TaxID=2823264 RepID=A0A8H5I1C9_9AGAR|nr:hypothetical protein D9757_000605 [Collybiopsis confluens]